MSEIYNIFIVFVKCKIEHKFVEIISRFQIISIKSACLFT